MGGQNCGDIGSALTVHGVASFLANPPAGLALGDIALEAIRHANRQVIAAARPGSCCEGMGSTVVLAMWNGSEIILSNVGDSRAYLFRDGELTQLSHDQNFANELRSQLGLSEERLRSIPSSRILTMAVGTFEEILIRTNRHALLPGDRILLCSDGLYVPVDHHTLTRILCSGGSLADQVDRLIDCANQHGGPDNITAVLLQHD